MAKCVCVCLQSKNDRKHTRHEWCSRAGVGRWWEGSPEVDNCWVCAANGNQMSPDSPIHAYLNAEEQRHLKERGRQTVSFPTVWPAGATHCSLCWSLFVADNITTISLTILQSECPNGGGLSKTCFYYIFIVNMMVMFPGWKSGLKPTKACDLKMPQVDTRWKNTEQFVFSSTMRVCGFGGWAKGHLKQQEFQSIPSMLPPCMGPPCWEFDWWKDQNNLWIFFCGIPDLVIDKVVGSVGETSPIRAIMDVGLWIFSV